MTLEEVAMGKRVWVTQLTHTGSIRRRLLDLGIIENTEIQPVLTSPSHHMRAYFVKGTLIALREGEGMQILVEERG